MYRAIIVSKQTYNQIFELVNQRNVVFPGTGEFRLLAAPEEEIPQTIMDSVQPVRFYSKYEGSIGAYPHDYHLPDQIPGDIYLDGVQVPWQEHNRELTSMKSKLGFTLSEMFSPEDVYFKLVSGPNQVSTRRTYHYQLRYNDLDCEATDDFIQMFRESLKVEIGPLLVSTWTLDFPGIPRWYLRESFRDILELGEIDLEDYTVITGIKSGNLYLFYKHPVNLLDETISKFISNLKGQIGAMLELKIFPRATPSEIIKNKRLTKLPNGQWRLNYELPGLAASAALETLTQKAVILKTADDLFWFLAWLMIQQTWSFIESEMKIYAEPNQIRVIYESKYLPDVIRVVTAGNVQAPTTNAVMIYYPKRLSRLERSRLSDKVYIQFYDQANQELAMLVTDDPRADQLEFLRNSRSSAGKLQDRILVDSGNSLI